MQAVNAWMDAAGISTGPLFVRIRRGDHPQPGQRMSVNGTRQAIKQAAEAAGTDGRISGHSLRIGSAVNLVRVGAQAPEVEQAGRWKEGSAMIAHYARHEFAEKNAIVRYKYGRG